MTTKRENVPQVASRVMDALDKASIDGALVGAKQVGRLRVGASPEFVDVTIRVSTLPK